MVHAIIGRLRDTVCSFIRHCCGAGLIEALSFSNRYLLGSTGETMLARLRGRLYDHLQALPLAYFHQRRRGEVLALLGNDAAHISNFVTSTLVGLLPLLITSNLLPERPKNRCDFNPGICD